MKKIYRLLIGVLILLVVTTGQAINIRAEENISANISSDNRPNYSIHVNRTLNCVTIYKIDDKTGQEVPFKAMVCSCGRKGHATPVGTFKIYDSYDWRLMVDHTWAQYAVRFNGMILFHSVPYLKKDPGTLEYDQFNLLGENASLGCVRLCVADAKWIYDNCKMGTKVVVYADEEDPGPLGKPTPMKIDEDSINRGWDPTDIKDENPWIESKESIIKKSSSETKPKYNKSKYKRRNKK